MTDDIVRWDAEHDGGLLVVSARADDELAKRGLRAPLVIDEAGDVGRSFGAGGTPMAVLIAPDGAIASSVAAGRDAVLRVLAELETGAASTAV